MNYGKGLGVGGFMDRIAEEISKVISRPVKISEPMFRHTSLKIGGPADLFIEPESSRELAMVIASLKTENIPYFILGNGTNLLVSDGGYRGAIIHLCGEFKQIKYYGTTVTAGAAVKLATLARDACQRGLGGLQFAAGIPATIGGALKMNAGAHGHCIGDLVSLAQILSEQLEIHTLRPEEMGLTYRKSSLPPHAVVCKVELSLIPSDSHNLLAECQKNLMFRSRQPRQPRQPNAGSVFKNPSQDAAGRLIEAVGLKGYKVGGAMFSDVHANFIVNCGNATAADVLSLVEKAKDAVYAQFKIELELEILLLGY